MPGVSACDETLPKKSLMPTCPAGTVRSGPPNRNKSSASPTIAASRTRRTCEPPVENLERSAGMTDLLVGCIGRKRGRRQAAQLLEGDQRVVTRTHASTRADATSIAWTDHATLR